MPGDNSTHEAANADADSSPQNIEISGSLLGSVEGGLHAIQEAGQAEGGHFVFKLYKTDSGQFLCFREEPVEVSKKERAAKIAVVDSESEVIDFFGKHRLAQELYDAALIISKDRWFLLTGRPPSVLDSF